MARTTWEFRPPNWALMPKVGRYATIREALMELHRRRPRGALIVETGTSRSLAGREGDGWATLAWAWFARETGGHAFTVDISDRALKNSGCLTRGFEPFLDAICADSATYLREFPHDRLGTIDLLYLDSLDLTDLAASAAHSLLEFKAATPHLSPDAIVLFDDTREFVEPRADARRALQGKGMLAIPFAIANGFRIVFSTANQILIARGPEPAEPLPRLNPLSISSDSRSTESPLRSFNFESQESPR